MPSRPDSSDTARHFFDIPRPKTIKYIYGGQAQDCSDQKGWIIELEFPEYVVDPVKPQVPVQLATVRLRPGVSLSEAKKAVELAYRAIGIKLTGGRPGMSIEQRTTLESAIRHIAKGDVRLIKDRGKVKQLANVIKEVIESVGMSAGLSTIEGEIRRYRKAYNYPIKKYTRESHLP